MKHDKKEIISIDPTTYKVEHQDVEAVIGDEKQSEFFPRMKLKKWDNECNFSVGVIDDGIANSVVNKIGKEIVWSKGSKKATFYGIKKKENLNLSKIKWLKLGKLDPFVAAAEYELFRSVDWNDDEIVIATYVSSEPAIMYFGNTHADDYVDFDSIKIPQVRIPSPSANPYFFDEGLINIDLHYGHLNIPNLNDIWVNSMSEVLSAHGVSTYRKRGRGDKMFFKDGDIDVKFAHKQDALGIIAGYLNINCNYNDVYTKYYKPEEIPSHYDECYGLQVKYPTINHSLVDEFIERLGINLNVPVEIIEYTSKQLKKLNDITNGVMKEYDWVRYGIREDAGWEHFENEDGFEFNIIYDSKPDTNVEELSITTKNLTFYYQGELPKEDRTTGHRPAHVVGSYAVYHSFKKDNEYKTGKAFHIYRPIAEDSNGKKVWCDLDINVEAERLYITIPQKFLDEASYPVTVDPTFGYTTQGASNSNTKDIIIGSIFTGANGTVDKISVYIGSPSSGTKFQCGLYRDSDYILTSITEERTGITVAGWQDFAAGNIVGQKVLSSKSYLPTIWQDGTYDTIAYDTGDANQGKHQTYIYANPWPQIGTFSTSNTRKYSIYVTYTSATHSYAVESTTTALKTLPENADGTSVTTAASWANSAYVTITASTSSAQTITTVCAQPNTSGEYEIDIATGGAGSETVIGTVRGVRGSAAGLYYRLPFAIPISNIGSGVRVSARVRKSGIGTAAFLISYEYYATATPSGITYTTKAQKAYPAGAAGASVTPSGTAWNNSAYAQLTASTSAAIVIVGITIDIPVAVEFEVDIAKGGAGAETVVATLRGDLASNTGGCLYLPITTIIDNIATSTRVSCRVRKSGTSTSVWPIALVYYEQTI